MNLKNKTKPTKPTFEEVLEDLFGDSQDPKIIGQKQSDIFGDSSDPECPSND